MELYSKHDRIYRKLVPSVAKLSYDPLIKLVGDAIARVLALPFPELQDLPPNHLCIRVGAGNRIFNGHINFIQQSSRCWLTFLSRGYCTPRSDVVELGCGCGRIARALTDPPWDPWFHGTYMGIDIDEEMIAYCKEYFPAPRFQFMLSPHTSTTYSPFKSKAEPEKIFGLAIESSSKEFIYSLSLYTHLLESEVLDYVRESYRILRAGGVMYMTFFCLDNMELGGRWTFQHQRGNAYIEHPRYPEAAVAYRRAFMTELVARCGFRDITVRPGSPSELIARR